MALARDSIEVVSVPSIHSVVEYWYNYTSPLALAIHNNVKHAIPLFIPPGPYIQGSLCTGYFVLPLPDNTVLSRVSVHSRISAHPPVLGLVRASAHVPGKHPRPFLFRFRLTPTLFLFLNLIDFVRATSTATTCRGQHRPGLCYIRPLSCDCGVFSCIIS